MQKEKIKVEVYEIMENNHPNFHDGSFCSRCVDEALDLTISKVAEAIFKDIDKIIKKILNNYRNQDGWKTNPNLFLKYLSYDVRRELKQKWCKK